MTPPLDAGARAWAAEADRIIEELQALGEAA